ncbi:IclR family transcriptional regulator [Nocardia pseudovaccinii]|uniref:IclR family transcriptional regulator n=1 Tax=Nocardia pseudovaccinii TaxID=189540 RepID=UPI003D940332
MTTNITASGDFAGHADDDACYPKSVLGKVHLILGAFGDGYVRVKLSELSRRAGLPKPTTHRLARELVRWGLLEQRDEWYQLGVRVFELGQRTVVATALRDVSRPHLADLFAETRATTHLVVSEGDHVLFIDKIAGTGDRNSATEAGCRLPATCTAGGKLLLACRDSNYQIALRYAHVSLDRLTPRSLRSVDQLIAEANNIRRAGFAIDLEENAPGYCSIALPVVTSDRQVQAAVSITRRASYITAPPLISHLRTAASSIARAIETSPLLQHVEDANPFSLDSHQPEPTPSNPRAKTAHGHRHSAPA